MTSVPLKSEPPSQAYGAGAIIAGKYEVVRPLVESGTGTVWLVRNIALESHVALKLLRADLADADAADRLLQEARVAARLDHPAIVRVFDFGQTSQGDPFIVMDLLEGETLAALLSARGRVDPVKAVQIALPVLDALAMAHARGVVHRNLKPESILLAREAGRTQPKIVDFGMAETEQALGSSTIDARADLLAVCIILYECIAGRPAFQGEGYNEVGDAELWTILQRGLEEDPTASWSSARELGRALAEWLMRHGVDVDISGERLGAWTEPQSSKPRGLLSEPPPARGPSTSLGPSSQDAMATVIRPKRSQPFRALATLIATLVLLILGATIASSVSSRKHARAIETTPSPLPNTTAPEPFEPTRATTSAPPREQASAVVPVETQDQSSVDRSSRPKPAARGASVPKKTRPSANEASQSDLKDPY